MNCVDMRNSTTTIKSRTCALTISVGEMIKKNQLYSIGIELFLVLMFVCTWWPIVVHKCCIALKSFQGVTKKLLFKRNAMLLYQQQCGVWCIQLFRNETASFPYWFVALFICYLELNADGENVLSISADVLEDKCSNTIGIIDDSWRILNM